MRARISMLALVALLAVAALGGCAKKKESATACP